MRSELPMFAEYDCGYWNLPDRFGRVMVRRVPNGYAVVVVAYDRASLHKREYVHQTLHDLGAAKSLAWEISQGIQSGSLAPGAAWCPVL